MKKIPEFEDLKEMAKYWDENSSADHWDAMSPCEDTFERPKLQPVSIKIDPNMLRVIKVLARKKGISYSGYIRLLLSEGMERELRPINN